MSRLGWNQQLGMVDLKVVVLPLLVLTMALDVSYQGVKRDGFAVLVMGFRREIEVGPESKAAVAVSTVGLVGGAGNEN